MSNPPPRRMAEKVSSQVTDASGLEIVIPDRVGQGPSYGFQRLGQLWLWGIALLAIWGGLFTIAFAQGDSNNRFALLGIGGLVSAIIFFAVVDLQRRRHGVITDLHDYMLAMSFFFASIGLFWGIRYAVALTASVDITFFVSPDRPFTGMEATGWYPNANTIYAQAAAAALLAALQWLYLKPMEADSRNMNTVSWFVACVTPFALLLVGLGPWVNWSEGYVSYEIGIAMVSLCAISMLLAVESNNGLVFAITANVASFLTLIYEIVHDAPSGASAGGALSLMVFIVIVQGLLAASPRLDRKMVEKASIGLIIAAMMAMFYAVTTDMTLHLGPFKFAPENTFLTLPSMIWITILVAYFPAVHDNRIPWMPIGLAASLIFLPDTSNVIPWSICLVMVPYLLWNEKTREWVANWTFSLFAAAFFIVGWMTWFNDVENLNMWSSFPDNFDLVIAVVIIVSGEWASRTKKLNRNVFRFALFCVVGSPATIIGDDSLMPWIVALYLLASVIIEQLEFDEEGSFSARRDMSITIATSLSLTVLLAALGRLSLSDTPLAAIEEQMMGFNLLLALIAVAYFVIGNRMSKAELDIGILLKMISRNAGKSASFDPTTGTWSVDEELSEDESNAELMSATWGSIARFSLLGPLILFTTAMVSIKSNSLDAYPLWMLLFALPVGIIVREVLNVDGAASKDRAVGVWAMFAIALPMSVKLAEIDFNVASLLFDIIILSGPIIVHFVLLKRGLAPREELSKKADDMTLLGLVMLGMLDSSGGLALTALFAIVLWRAIIHRSRLAIYALPLMWLFFPGNLTQSGNFIHTILEPLGSVGEILLGTEYLFGTQYLRFVGLMWVIYAALALGKSAGDVQLRKRGEENIETLPFIYPGIVLFFGLDLILIEDAWLLCVVTTILLLFGWGAGRMEGFAFAPVAYFFSFLIGFESEGYNGFELFSITCFGTGLVVFALWITSTRGLLFKWAKEVISIEDLNQGLMTNVAGTAIFSKQPSMIRCATTEGREKLSAALRIWGLTFLLLSFDEVYGLSTLFVAIWVTWEAWDKKDRTLLLLTPALHAIALWNIERVAEIQGNDLAGWLLIIEGSVMSYLAAIKWYPNWGWSEDGEDYWKWNDMMIIFGATYGVVGIIWALWDLTDIGAALLIILYCGMQAAADFENSWRRITSLVGTSLGTFLVLFTDVDSTFAGIALIVGGLAAFAQAVLYFRIWGVDEGAVKAELTAPHEPEIQAKDYSEEITEVSAEEVPGDESEVDIEVAGLVESDGYSQLEDELREEDADPVGELEVQADTVGEVQDVQEVLESGRVSTTMGFDIDLPPEVLQNIRQSLAQTDTEGFTPVVGFDQYGRIILSFEPSNS